MATYGELRRGFAAALKSRLEEMGYVRLRAPLTYRYAKKSPDGLHIIGCEIDARYGMSVRLSFCPRFGRTMGSGLICYRILTH
jgi:hypothetical protein